MSIPWQQVITLAIVLIAAGYLVRRVWQLLAQPGCGGCGSCATKQETVTTAKGVQQVISIESLVKSARQDGASQETTRPGVLSEPGRRFD